MNPSYLPTPLLLVLLLAACSAQADNAEMLEETRNFAMKMPANLMSVLNEEIASGGLASAISVCSDKAPKMAQQASQKTGWNIRRVSLKNRNPKAVPDPWEASVLKEFDQLVATGSNPATLEKYVTVDEGGVKTYRYMKALPTQPLCLNCHGTAEDIPDGVKEKLHSLYPTDKATGYTLGQVRGAITIARPLP